MGVSNSHIQNLYLPYVGIGFSIVVGETSCPWTDGRESVFEFGGILKKSETTNGVSLFWHEGRVTSAGARVVYTSK